jgi:ubiquinone/menaquinone biosynthesis C-methylase UbiE
MSEVGEIYNRDPHHEWERLVRDAYHALEFEVTMHALQPHLPPGSLILDAGGGPGRYALALCHAGHRVVLLDAASELIRLAMEAFAKESPTIRERLVEYIVGDVRDVDRFEENHFDAVLCLGPLTHIPDVDERRQAVGELVRITRPEGIVCLGVGGYLAMLRTVMTRASQELENPAAMRLLEQGDNVVRGMRWHFFRAEELRALGQEAGLETVTMVGCEGLSTGLHQATSALTEQPEAWEQWRKLVFATAHEPALVDMAEHMVYVGRV